jgi:hypothetical protein
MVLRSRLMPTNVTTKGQVTIPKPMSVAQPGFWVVSGVFSGG